MPSNLLIISDHPRIRGEHAAPAGSWSTTEGSSPHTRGAPGFGSSWRRVRGIIPAYAGSTRWPRAPAGTDPDHPRIRGEHLKSSRKGPFHGGSSPHTRGALGPPSQPAGRRRIIPAYAGSTSCLAVAPILSADHPRIRGEHSGVSWIVKNGTGSSPHTRGAHRRHRHRHPRRGIIPAYAGSTSSYPTCELPRTDHPRIRGEHRYSWFHSSE